VHGYPPETFFDFNVHQLWKQNLTIFGIFILACTHSSDQYEYFGLYKYAVFILPLQAFAKPGAHRFPKHVTTASKSQALESLTCRNFHTGDPRSIGRHRTKFSRHGDWFVHACPKYLLKRTFTCVICKGSTVTGGIIVKCHAWIFFC